MKKYLSTLLLLLISLAALSGCGLNFESEKEPRQTLDVSQWPSPAPPTDTPKPTPFPKSTLPAQAPATSVEPAVPTAQTELDVQQFLTDTTALAGLDLTQLSKEDANSMLAGLGLGPVSNDDAANLMADLNLSPVTAGGATTNLLNQANALSGLEPVAVLKTSAAKTTIRQGPGETYGAKTVVEQGELAAVLGQDASNKWLYVITLENIMGWLPLSDVHIVGTLDKAPVLPPNPNPQPVAKAGTIAAGGSAPAKASAINLKDVTPVTTARVGRNEASLRQRPGPEFKLIGTLPTNTEVAVLGVNRDGHWALITAAGGKTGWASLDFLDVTGSLAAAPVYRTLDPLPAQPTDQPAPVVLAGSNAVTTTVTAAAAAIATTQPAAEATTQPAANAIPGDKAFATAATAQITEKTDLRTGPGLEFGTLAETVIGQDVTVLAVNPARDWVFVRTPLSKYGWTAVSAINVTDGALTNAKPVTTALVTSDNLTVSSGPGIYFEAVGAVARNEFVAALGVNPGRNWALVETIGGGRGWLSLRLLKVSGLAAELPLAPEPAAPAASAQVAALPAPSGPPTGKLIFQTSSGGDIMTINADGSGLRRVISGGIDPVLSPDGKQIAFTRWQGDTGTLWVANADGSGERAVLGEMRKAKGPDWSPDGQRIVLNFQQGGREDDKNVCHPLGSDVPYGRATNIRVVKAGKGKYLICYTLQADPHWTLRLINVADGKFEEKYGGQYAFRPAWDPAQKWRIVSAAGNGLLAVDVNNADYHQQLTTIIGDGSPAVSPDGRFIAVTTKNTSGSDIYRLNADGSGRVQLTQTPLWEGVKPDQDSKQWHNVAPVWSPDGSRLAFLTDRAGRWEIWVMNADGSTPQPLFTPAVNDQLKLEYNFVDERVFSWR